MFYRVFEQLYFVPTLTQQIEAITLKIIKRHFLFLSRYVFISSQFQKHIPKIWHFPKHPLFHKKRILHIHTLLGYRKLP